MINKLGKGAKLFQLIRQGAGGKVATETKLEATGHIREMGRGHDGRQSAAKSAPSVAEVVT